MRRNGFALLAVLWIVAAVSGAVGAGLAGERLGQRATLNRVLLARGRWAAEACLAVAASRWGTPRAATSDTVDLGRGTRCSWRLDDPGARLNVNVADREALARLLAGTGLAADSAERLAHLIASRRAAAPWSDAAELLDAAGVSAAALPLLTVDGSGTVNVNAAPPAVLVTLPGITPEAVDAVRRRRAAGRAVASLDDLAGALSPVARAALLARYGDLAPAVTFAPAQLLLTADGWVASHGEAPVATIELLVVPLPARLATVRRRMR